MIDTCLNKVGFTTKSGLRWSFRGGEDKSPGALARPVHCWKTLKGIVFLEKKKKKKESPKREDKGNFSTLYMIFIQVVDISRGISLSDTRLFLGGHTGLVFMFIYVR